MDNNDGDYSGPDPDHVPDENEVVGTKDLDPLVFLEKLRLVQEHFEKQLSQVQSMVGKMETRALKAEAALKKSERAIENMVGFNTSLVNQVAENERAVEKATKRSVNPAVVGKKKSVSIAIGPDIVSSPTPTPRRTNDADGGRGSALKAAGALNKLNPTPSVGLNYSPILDNSLNTTLPSLNFCGEGSSPVAVVPIPKPRGRRVSGFVGSRTSEAEEALFDREEIMNLGLDFVSSQSAIVKEVQRVEQIAYRGLGAKASFSTRKKAIETPPFTGDI